MFDAQPKPAAPSAPDDAGPRERMGIVRKMAEIGVRMGERLDRQSELAAVYAETCAVPEHLQPPYARRLDEIARAFAQVCRAVTLAVALEERIDADRRLGPDALAERALRRQGPASRVAAAQPDLGADAASAPDAPHAPDLRVRVDRLLDGGLGELDALLARPEAEVVAQIRAALGLDAAPTPFAPPPPGRDRPIPAEGRPASHDPAAGPGPGVTAPWRPRPVLRPARAVRDSAAWPAVPGAPPARIAPRDSP